MATDALIKIIAQLRALEAVQEGALDRRDGEQVLGDIEVAPRRTRFLGEQESTTDINRTFALAEDTRMKSADLTRERFSSRPHRQQTAGEP